LEQFSNLSGTSGIVQGSFFLRKKPLWVGGSSLQELENSDSVETVKELLILA